MTRSLIALLLIGCASAASHQQTAPLSEPEIHISQLSKVSDVARHITGNILVQYRVEVTNRSNQAITIKRVDVVSLGAGAYTLRPTSNPFDAQLKPGEATALEFWAPAVIEDPTIIGANGPVTLRVALQYATPGGGSQAIVVQQVHALPGAD